MRDLIQGLGFELPASVRRVFSGWRLLVQLCTIPITYACVVSGFDWSYFNALAPVQMLLFPAALLGFFVPVSAPLIVYIVGLARRDARALNLAYALGQSELFGMLLSFAYKAFTGRAHPQFFAAAPVDLSRVFDFGFLRGGVFWGWPSSHSAVAFAFFATLWVMFPSRPWLRYGALAYALYVAIGVSATIHWFSDAVSGTMIGIAVGSAVGMAFLRRPASKTA